MKSTVLVAALEPLAALDPQLKPWRNCADLASTPTAAPTPTPAPSSGLLPDTTAAPADAGPAGSLALLMVGSTILLAGVWRFSARRRASRSG